MHEPVREAAVVSPVAHEKAHTRLALAALLASLAAVVIAVMLAVYLLWIIVSQPKATGFDADGVRCYRAASEMTCIKTAEPPR